MVRRAVMGIGMAALAVACAASPGKSPRDALSAYANALREGRTHDAYDLLSADAKKDIPYESFERIVRENPSEVRDIAGSLGQPAAPPRVTAVVKAPNGEALRLVLEDGAWRVDGSAVDL